MAGNVLAINRRDRAIARRTVSRVVGARDILYFKVPGSDSFFLDELAQAGWTPFVVEDPSEAEKLAKSRGISVGLFFLGPCCGASQWQQIEDLAAGSSLAWIALVPENCGEDAECWPLIDGCCWDYHRLPIDLQRLLTVVGHADGMARLRRRFGSLWRSSPTSDLMIGNSAAMRRVGRKLAKIASADTPVLITGETGTGKELAARIIHEHSCRAKGPFETVNCGALPADLIQSELFGHEKGSFTGAYYQKIGRFEAADGGTILLDEIGDLPANLQVTLLRVLEEKKIRRVGATQDIPIDVRVLAATHVDLQQAVKDRRFREDLYYRLNVLQAYLPPLRERDDDAEYLAEHFLRVSAKRQTKGGLRFTRQARIAIRNYDWPGNVRELINCVERAVVMTDTNLITPADLSIGPRTAGNLPQTLEAARATVEKQAVISALYHTDNNLAQAARDLGVSRVTVYRLIEKYNIDV